MNFLLLKSNCLFLLLCLNYSIAFSWNSIFPFPSDTINNQIIEEAIDRTDEPQISFIAYWKIGDSYEFNVKKIQKKWKDSNLVNNDSSEYTVKFLVIDSTENDYTIEYKYQGSEYDTYPFLPETKEALSKYDTTTVYYKTDKFGAYKGIQNWEELSKMTLEVFEIVITDQIKTEAKKNDDTAPLDSLILKKVMQPLIDAHSSQAGIENLFKEIPILHFPFGAAFNPADTLYYEDKYANLFGGEPLKALGMFYFDSYNWDTKRCLLKNYCIVDEEDSKRLISELLSQMGQTVAKDKKVKKLDKEVDSVLERAKMIIQDEQSYDFFYYPGIPISIENIRTTEYKALEGSSYSIDATYINLIE